MSNESLPVCPQCGAALKASAPAGLCPSCLMTLNLKTETVFTDDPPAAQPPLPPEQLAPHFPQLEILEYLGRGGMGVVYKARQKTLNRLVALKLLAPERVGDAKFAERFTREAQALAALNHPNIVTIHDFGQAGGYYFLLMEFVDGLNLRQLLRARKLTPEEALAIVPPLCDALQFAHDRGIIHRDIKPENLLLDKDGRVKVADFGIAKMIEPESGRADLPVSPEVEAAQQHGPTGVMGTPGYSAPEQKTDPQRVDSRADIYSLGVVFYEMLTGELPGNRIEPPSRKVQIDVRLDEVVLRALEKKPELRYQQASQVKTAVETILGSAGGPPAEPGGARGATRDGWWQRHLMPDDTVARFAQLACFGVALVVLVMGIFKLATLELRPHELLFGVVVVLILSVVMVVLGLLAGVARAEVRVTGEFPNSQLAGVALFFAGLSGVLGFTTFCFFPHPPEMLVWSVLAAALLGIAFGIRSRETRLGKQAIAVGGVNTAIWLIVAVAVQFISNSAQPKQAMNAATTPRTVTFSRELEKSLNSLGSDAGNHFLDLDTAHYAQPPRQYSSWSRERKHEWLRENGIDLMIMGNGNQPWNLLTPVDNETKFTKVPADSWERSIPPASDKVHPERAEALQFIDQDVELLQLRLEGRPTNPDNFFAFQTANGSRGLLQISGIKLGNGGEPIGLKLRLKQLQRPPATARVDTLSGNQTTPHLAPRTEYAARLPDGSFVELISLMYGSKPNGAAGQAKDSISFWKPDGSALVGAVDWSFTPASGWQADPSQDSRAFVVRWGGPLEAQPSLQTWEFDGRPGAAGSFRITPHAESAGHWLGLIHGFARGQNTATVRFALASGPFATGPRPGKEWSNSGQTSFGSFLIGAVFDHNGTAAVTLTHNLQGCDYRLRTTTPVARKPHSWVGGLLWEWKQEFTRGAPPQPVFGRIVEGNAMDRQSLETWEFPGVSVKDAGVITFEVRPMQWVEFRNVALKPGKVTHPEICVEDAAAGASSGTRKSEVSQHKFVRLVVDKAAMTFEGQPTTWDGVDTLLDAVADRSRTVLEFAVTSDQITVQQQNDWFGKCAALAKRHGFEYASFIGIHSLGSKGSFDSLAKSVSPISRAGPGEFKLTLPNGVSSEVVAVTANPLANQPWWQPDGTPLPQSPGERVIFHPAGMASEKNLGEKEHALLVRCNFPPGAQSARQQTRYSPQPEHLGTLEIQQGSSVTQAAESVSRTLRKITGGAGGSKSAGQVVGLADVVRFPPGTAEVTVQFATAAGPWEALASFDGRRTTVRVKGVQVLCTQLRQEANGKCLDVTHDVNRDQYALRMVAVFKDGEREEVALHSGVLSARETQGYVRLEPGQRVENIQEFVLERTPWVRGEIRNIALRPKLGEARAAAAFGPEKEVTLTEFNSRDGQEALDLDSGTVFKQPKDTDQWSEEGLGQWVKENGVDLFMDHGPEGVWGLLTTTDAELKLARLGNERWGAISVEELDRVLAAGSSPLQVVTKGRLKIYAPPKEAQPPMTYAFKTSSGGVGVLHITGFTENPRGVQIRYKLAQRVVNE